MIHVGGVTATRGTAALRELAETPEPLYFRLLVHVDSLAIGASWLSTQPSDVELGKCRALLGAAILMPVTSHIGDLAPSEHDESRGEM